MPKQTDDPKPPQDNVTAAQPPAQQAPYTPPAIYVIGEARDLLRGCGKHKNDDTGRSGMVVG